MDAVLGSWGSPGSVTPHLTWLWLLRSLFHPFRDVDDPTKSVWQFWSKRLRGSFLTAANLA